MYSTQYYSQELTADSCTTLLLHFNNNLIGDQSQTPTTYNNITYETGIYGHAVYSGILYSQLPIQVQIISQP